MSYKHFLENGVCKTVLVKASHPLNLIPNVTFAILTCWDDITIVYTVVLNYLARISGAEVSVVETFSCSTIVDHAESWFHAARVVVTLLARKASKWRSRADTVWTPVIFSAGLIISAWQSIVVCPGQLVGTVTILLNSNISSWKVFCGEQFSFLLPNGWLPAPYMCPLLSPHPPPSSFLSFTQCYKLFSYFSWLLPLLVNSTLLPLTYYLSNSFHPLYSGKFPLILFPFQKVAD